MVIEGIQASPKLWEASTTDHVGASVEALEMLGLVRDREQLTESVANEFAALAQSGRDGEPYIQLPRKVISLAHLITASDAAVYKGGRRYLPSYIYYDLWTPGLGRGGYNTDELDNLTAGSDGDFPVQARLAVHNPYGVDEPLLHFAGMPFDETHAELGEQTQLDSVDTAIKAYEAEDDDGRGEFDMTPLNAKAVVMIALTRRVKGAPMPIELGYMLDATLSRHTVGNSSIVGAVDYVGGQLMLTSSHGIAQSAVGVGLSVGRKENNHK